MTLLVTDLDRAGDLYAELGDARAFAIVHEQFRRIDDRVRREGGALVKTVLEGTVSAFADPAAAVRAALGLPGDLAGGEATGEPGAPGRRSTGGRRWSPRSTTTSTTSGPPSASPSRLPGLARGGQVVLTRPVAADPRVAALLDERGLAPSIVEVDVEGLADPFVHDPGVGHHWGAGSTRRAEARKPSLAGSFATRKVTLKSAAAFEPPMAGFLQTQIRVSADYLESLTGVLDLMVSELRFDQPKMLPIDPGRARVGVCFGR